MKTADKPTRLFFSLGPASKAAFVKNPDGSGTITGIEVFKAGTFRDSMGVQDTWTAEHLGMMVSNFNLLRSKGILADVPWRADHNRSVQNVIGYVSNLYVEGDKLKADVNLTEPDAAAKYERGTYRARSAEIGVFQANDESMYWPTVTGVAFVDIGAVQGLFNANVAEPVAFVNLDREVPAVPENQMTEAQFAAACTYAAWIEANPSFPEGPAQWERAATYAQALADLQAVPAASVVNGERTFSVNGQSVADATAVQAHISSLEKFAADTRDANRAAFITGLVGAKKIAQTQVDSLKAVALTMSDSQFEAFKASYEAAPVLSLFGTHAANGGVTNANGEPAPGDDEKSILEGTLREHRRAGMSEDQIKQTKSYQRLQALQASA